MSLIGNTYVQSSDPGAVGFGYYWMNSTTGAIKVRNTTNTAWVTVGNTDQSNIGLLPKTGGKVTGNITGPTGWSPDTSNDFTSLSIGGYDVSTEAYVDTKIAALEAAINSKVQSAMNTYANAQAETSSIDINKYIATTSGVLTFVDADSAVQDLDLPVFVVNGVNSPSVASERVVTLCRVGAEFYPTGASGGAGEDWLFYMYDQDGNSINATNYPEGTGSITGIRAYLQYYGASYYSSGCSILYHVLAVRSYD